MFIKQVIIEGFRSYGKKTTVEPFSKKHNVVVGKNGSGKSNFLYAIQFVLSEEYSCFTNDERLAHLYEGTGPRVITAFVEIIFDNTERRLHIQEDKVSVRRVFGVKTDQYFVNNKQFLRSDVMNMLDGAGLSRSNPHFIIKQGKINEMTTASDEERLRLLKEIAGTNVYKKRKKEIQEKLSEIRIKQAHVDEFVKDLERSLQASEEEKTLVMKYKKLEKNQKSLQFCIYNLQLKENEDALQKHIIEKRASEISISKLKDVGNASIELNKILQELKRRSVELKVNIKRSKCELDPLLKEISILKLNIAELRRELLTDEDLREKSQAELNELNRNIESKLKSFSEEIKPKYEELKKKEEDYDRELSLKNQKKKEFYDKLYRGNQFASKVERDEWIDEKLKSLQENIQNKKEQIDDLKKELESDTRKKEDFKAKIVENDAQLAQQLQIIDNQRTEIFNMRNELDSLNNKFHELHRDIFKMQRKLEQSKEDLHKKRRSMRFVIGKAVFDGIDSVNKVIETFRERGGKYVEIAEKYFGLVINNFSCDEAINIAVDVTAKTKLFYHIVQNSEIGNEILKEMDKQKLMGEPTFIPLNISSQCTKYQTEDAFLMITKMNFDEKFKRVMIYIFGKTLICRTFEIAIKTAGEAHLDCITLDGKQSSHRGDLTGGYLDPKYFRLAPYQQLLKSSDDVLVAKEDLKVHEINLELAKNGQNKLHNDIQKLETKISEDKFILEKLKENKHLWPKEIESLDQIISSRESSLSGLHLDLKNLEAKEESFIKEKDEELLKEVSVLDQQELDRLNDEIRILNRNYKDALNKCIESKTEKNNIQNWLNYHNARKEDLLSTLQNLSMGNRKLKLINSQSKLENLTTRIDDLIVAKTRLENELEEKTKEIETMTQKLLEAESKEIDNLEKLRENFTVLRKNNSVADVFRNKCEENKKKIQELGVLYSRTREQFQGKNLKELNKMLRETNKELKKLGFVNKLATNKFDFCLEQRDDYNRKKDELNKSHDKFMDTIVDIRLKKYAAIGLTFKQVSKYFSDIFTKLNPNGQAFLIMKCTEEDQTAETMDEAGLESEAIKKIVGVGIKVSFTGHQRDMKEMRQLSGGQKTLVALALIFAIQKCDPAPFYIFDEIDQALDSPHRNAVAVMISELSKNAQFITTTFRPEFLEHADKYYGVRYRNKCSHIDVVTKQNALSFVGI